MGYTTYFSGSVSITPPLNDDEIEFLRDFNMTRRMHRSGGPLFVKGEGAYGQGAGPDTIHDSNNPDPDQPGLWCQWVPFDDGTALEWDAGEKFYEAADWMEYIVNRLLSPAARAYVDLHVNEDPRLKSFTCDHVVNGEIYADGEESDDNWKIKVTNNKVEQLEATLTYGDEEPEVVPPTAEELRATLKSLGADEAIPTDLRLSFTPEAIREHFEDDDDNPIAGMTDEQLAEVGRLALQDDGLYRAFHEALAWALKEQA